MFVFAWSTYYPCGGWHDFIGHARSLDAAHALIKEHRTMDTYQIVDSDGSIVQDGYVKDLLQEWEQKQTEVWHCNRCDEDQPHVILDRAEMLPDVKTECTNCGRETWR